MEATKYPLVIAMKGHPCTGKSTLAQILARDLNCVVIDRDDVLHCIANLQQSPQASPSSTAQLVNNRCMEAICRIALRHMRLGNLNVIIDSPLSQQVHLQRLLKLSADAGARLVIVECKPQDHYEWQRRLRERHSTDDDLQMLLERYEGIGEYDSTRGDDDEGGGGVSKLVVNTTECILEGYIHWLVCRLSAYKSIHCVNFHEWMAEGFRPLEADEVVIGAGAGAEAEVEIDQIEGESQIERLNGGPFDHFHRFTLSTMSNTEEKGRLIRCRGCVKPISGPFYSCTECDLSLHKLCAELADDKKHLAPNQTPPFIDPITHQYSFPETHRCHFHAKDNMEYSADCTGCLYETHLRCGLVPTIIFNGGHQHPLFLFVQPVFSSVEFKCDACGHIRRGPPGYSCYECNLQLDVNCAMLPPTRKDIHHRHPLTLIPPPMNIDPLDLEIYCNSCETTRNPRNWLYCCADCNFASHLYCQ
ncbi:hypothetical protein Acr_24g0017500 [Actinidia rufa]|uniref:DC1 domain-containing protein n=1 Tax=Actinidia rufa TaxID=165716 RepID=A0A7J0GXK4_9ERIC|nr:hypothetical protein Acr_24g0017500 [Actinidia rufa]